jgi:outer membrane biosynthesis protein TonB
MLGEDLSGRFDYLFEPLEVDESAGDGDDAALQALEEPDDDNRWSRRIVLTGVVLATMAAAVATAIVLLQPAQPRQLIVTPSDATPPSTPGTTAMSTATPTTTAQPSPVAPATVSPSAIQTSAPTGEPQRPPVQPQNPPAQKPTTVASEPPAPMPPPPTTRAPISVSPESRAPFPNQTPPRNNQNGGLLGGLL